MIEIKPLDSLKTIRECALKLLEEASEACEALKEHNLERGRNEVPGTKTLKIDWQ